MIVYKDNNHRGSCGALSLLFRDLHANTPYAGEVVSTVEAYSRVLFDNFELFEQKIKELKKICSQ
jgi:hypothetical protein